MWNDKQAEYLNMSDVDQDGILNLEEYKAYVKMMTDWEQDWFGGCVKLSDNEIQNEFDFI